MGLRFDRAPLGKITRTASGAIRVEARLARTGIQTYRDDAGREIREYRPPSAVFAPEALDGLRGAPITDLHPKHSRGVDRVDAENWRDLAIGHVGDNVREDGAFVAADVVIADAAAIRRVESRERVEVSVGYRVESDPTPGVTPEGERYDAIQTRITPNHVALVPRGRAGREVALRLDSEDNERIDSADQEGSDSMKIKIAGKEYEAGSPEAVAALAALEQAAQRADAADAALRAERSRAMRARVTQAKIAFKADADDPSIMLDVIKKIAPDVDLSGASPEAIMGAFQVAISIALAALGKTAEPADKPAPDAAPPGTDGASAARADADAPRRSERDDADAVTAAEIYEKHLAEARARAFVGLR